MRPEISQGLGDMARGAAVTAIGAAEFKAVQTLTAIPYGLITMWVPNHPVLNFARAVGKNAIDNAFSAAIYNWAGDFVTKGSLKPVEREHAAWAVGIGSVQELIRPAGMASPAYTVRHRLDQFLDLGNSVSLRGEQTFLGGAKTLWNAAWGKK